MLTDRTTVSVPVKVETSFNHLTGLVFASRWIGARRAVPVHGVIRDLMYLKKTNSQDVP